MSIDEHGARVGPRGTRLDVDAATVVDQRLHDRPMLSGGHDDASAGDRLAELVDVVRDPARSDRILDAHAARRVAVFTISYVTLGAV